MITRDSIINFGQYKGRTISVILGTNPSYLYWCMHNIGWFYKDLSTELKREIEVEHKKYERRLPSRIYSDDRYPSSRKKNYGTRQRNVQSFTDSDDESDWSSDFCIGPFG